MKDEVMGAVAQLLTLFVNGLQQGVDFTKEQLPLLVQEFLSFSTVAYILFCFVWLIVALIFVFLAKFGYKKAEEAPYEAWQVLWLFSSLFSLISVGVAVYNLYYILYITMAPRMFLIQEFSKLVR